MSFEAVNAIRGATIEPELEARVSVDRARLVLKVLAHHANEYNVADPTVGSIAADLCIPPSSVRSALRLLEAQALIEPVGGRSGGRYPTCYRVVVG